MKNILNEAVKANKKMSTLPLDTQTSIYEEAYAYVYQRAAEEGDVDIDVDYPIVDKWFDEYIVECMKRRSEL